MLQRIFGLLLLINYASAFIVPQEVPSLLSLVYSNIPPIKKGTDSRVGFGYRLGEHADFQVVFELGPQTNTKPLGNAAGEDDSDTSKRNVDQNDYVMKNSPNPEGTEWLANWSQDMKTKTKKGTQNSEGNEWIANWSQDMKTKKGTPKPAQTVDTSHKVQTGPFISESALRQLQQLYSKAQAQNGAEPTLPDSIGTLPAIAMDEVVKSLAKSRKNILPNTVREPESQSAADKSKITADLMDVDLD